MIYFGQIEGWPKFRASQARNWKWDYNDGNWAKCDYTRLFSSARILVLDVDPEARLVVSSGYATDPIMTHYQAYGFRERAVKSFSLAELQSVIEQMLVM